MCKRCASTVQALCKHRASCVQARSFFVQARLWARLLVVVFASSAASDFRPSSLIIILEGYTTCTRCSPNQRPAAPPAHPNGLEIFTIRPFAPSSNFPFSPTSGPAKCQAGTYSCLIHGGRFNLTFDLVYKSLPKMYVHAGRERRRVSTLAE